MALSVVASTPYVSSTAGGPAPSQVSGSFTYPAVTDGMAVMCVFANNNTDSITPGSPTFDGNGTTELVDSIGSSTSGGNVIVHINYLALGTVSGATVNVFADVTGGSNQTGVGIVVMVLEDCAQSPPATLTGTNSATGPGSTVSTNTGGVTELVIDILARASGDFVGTPGAGQTSLGKAADGFGDPISGASSSKSGTGSSVTSTWNFTFANYSACSASFIESGGATGPNISTITKDSAREASIVNPDDTAVAVTGTDFDPVAAVGPTSVYLADGPIFMTATTVSQTISTLTNTTFNWDVSMGSFAEGDLFLFVVTDEGEAGEEVSPAFPVIVSFPDVHVEVRNVPTVASGPITENFDFPVKCVIATVSGGNPDGTVIANSTHGYIFTVDGGFDASIAVGSSNGVNQYQREVNINVDGSVNILPNGNSVTASVIFGAISISGNDVNFTNTITTTGYSINMLVIGGRTAKADAAYVLVSDGSYTGTGFKPDALIAATTGETFNSGGDGTFALSSLGVAVGSAAGDQWVASVYEGSTTANKNSVIDAGSFSGQLNEGSFTWQVSLTTFDVNGITWSGTNADGMIICMINTDTLGVFVTTTNKPATATTQVLPDFGFTPGGMLLTCCTKTTGTVAVPSPGMARLTVGIGDINGNTSAFHLIDGNNVGTSDAEMSYDTSKILMVPDDLGGSFGIETSATLDAVEDSTPSITWDSAGSASLMGVFGIEGAPQLSIKTVTKDPAREPRIVNPDDVDVAVTGAGFEIGATVLYLADGPVFATATKVLQTIDTVTTTSFDWDVSLGALAEGDLFLFVVTNESQPSEVVSSAFLVIVSEPDVQIVMRPVASVASGPHTENFDFPVKCVIGIVSGGTPDGTSIANSTFGMFFVSVDGFDAGNFTGSTSGALEFQREFNDNANGSIIIFSNGDELTSAVIFGRASISGNDVTFTYTTTTTGYSLNLLVIGGKTAKAKVDYVQVSSGSYSGTGFKPDLVIGSSSGLTFGTNFAGGSSIFSFGVAAGTAAGDQWSVNTFQGSDGTGSGSKNATMGTGNFCGQLSGASITWSASLTSFDSDGITWSGSDADGMIICMVNTDTLGVFATTVNKPTTATTQVLPDFGFIPGGILLSSCTKTSVSTPLRSPARSELTIGFGDLEGNTTALHAITGDNGGTSDGEMSFNTSKILIVPNDVASSFTIEASATLNPIVNSTPSIVWDSTGEGSLMGVFGIEATAEEIENDIFAQMFDI